LKSGGALLLYEEGKKMTKCILCGTEFEGRGNDPSPLAGANDGVCCDECHGERVIPARMRRAEGEEVADDG
jgi:hypothetical protein